jgi:uncharacterized protein (TIGR02118 family)
MQYTQPRWKPRFRQVMYGPSQRFLSRRAREYPRHGVLLRETHPFGSELLGAALKGVSVEEGIAGGAVGTPPPFVAAGHLSFESLDAFAKAFPPILDQLVADIPNYTNTKPTIQISEVRL